MSNINTTKTIRLPGIKEAKKNVNDIQETNTNQQQVLELFKLEVINCLKKEFNYTKEEIKDCFQERKEIWEQYMKDFSPEIVAQGIASGLI